jgi:hypothetical protein
VEERLDNKISYYRRLVYSESTKASYASHLKSYVSFCSRLGYPPVPASTRTIARYIAHLSDRIAPQSIPAYLNIIRLLHLESNLQNPVNDNFFLSGLLKGIRKDKGIKVKQALPITPLILLKIRCVIDLTSPYWSCFWAACLVGFFGFLRKSNMFVHKLHNHHLIREHVRIVAGRVIIRLTSTKTIQYKNRVVELPLPYIPLHPLCPVTSLMVLFRQSQTRSPSDPVFAFNTVTGLKHMTYTDFTASLRNTLHKLGMNPSQYSGHSLRRGGATFALQSGVSGEVIKLLGDWRSDAYQTYLDLSLSHRTQALSTLVKNLPL